MVHRLNLEPNRNKMSSERERDPHSVLRRCGITSLIKKILPDWPPIYHKTTRTFLQNWLESPYPHPIFNDYAHSKEASKDDKKST